MSEIDTAVNESAQSSQEANAQAESLSHQSESLNDIIHLFEKEIKGEPSTMATHKHNSSAA